MNSRIVIDLREAANDLPALDFTLGDTEEAIARQIRIQLEAMHKKEDE